MTEQTESDKKFKMGEALARCVYPASDVARMVGAACEWRYTDTYEGQRYGDIFDERGLAARFINEAWVDTLKGARK